MPMPSVPPAHSQPRGACHRTARDCVDLCCGRACTRACRRRFASPTASGQDQDRGQFVVRAAQRGRTVGLQPAAAESIHRCIARSVTRIDSSVIEGFASWCLPRGLGTGSASQITQKKPRGGPFAEPRLRRLGVRQRVVKHAKQVRLTLPAITEQHHGAPFVWADRLHGLEHVSRVGDRQKIRSGKLGSTSILGVVNSMAVPFRNLP